MDKRGLKERFVKNSFWSFTSATINRTGALIFTIILARFLLPENYGIYSIVLSTVMIFFTFADLGIGPTFTRYVSEALVKKKKDIPSYHVYLLKLKLITTSAFCVLLLLLAYPLSLYVFKNLSLFQPFLVAAFYLFILSLEGFYGQVFFIAEKVEYLSYKESIGQVLRIILALFVFYYITAQYHVIGVFWALILSTLAIFLFAFYYSKKLIPELYEKPKTKINGKKVIGFAGWLTIAGISGVFFSNIDAVMLGIFLKPEFVGYYKAAFSLVIGVIGFVSFPNALLLPVFTKISRKKSENVLNMVFRYFSIITIPSIVGLLVLGKYFIRTLYGHSYLDAVLPFYFLAFTIFPIATIGLILPFFSAKEKPEILAKLIAVVGILNVILNFILIKTLLSVSPNWANAGAAIATLISWIIYFILSINILKKRFRIKVSFRDTIKPTIASFIMAGILLFSLRFIVDMTLATGIIEIVLGVLIYFGAMILLGGIGKEDLNVVRLLLNKGK